MTVPISKPQPITTTTVYRCQECDYIGSDTGGPLYECGTCYNVFTAESSPYGNHQCDCGKFARTRADKSCAECSEGEVEEVQGFECSCHDEWHVVG